MNTIALVGIFLGVGLVVALIIEDSREFLIEVGEYIISFEWFGDIADFFGGMFEDLGEFSPGGLLFAVASFGMVFALRKWMLQPFLVHMSPGSAMFWGGATYAITVILGYLVGKKIFDD